MNQYRPILLFFITLLLMNNPAASQDTSDYSEVNYEQCDCTNNKFTKHLTEPYKKEIEEWFIQTASPEERSTEAGASCIDCQTPSKKEDIGPLTSIWDTISKLWKRVISKKISPPLPVPSPVHKKKTKLIPSICFQMSGKMTDEKPVSRSEFFTCIHKHYDGSDSDNMCTDTVNKPGYPKKCFAIPVSCEDTRDPTINCAIKFKDREENNRPNGCNKGSSFLRRPCLNEEYTAMTAKAFHDVAECLNIPHQLAFPILHHEARFLLNNESHTGALCYAQVTGDAIADFNTFLDSKPNYPAMKELLPENIKARCPEKWKHFKKVNTRYNKKRKKFVIKSNHDKCKLNLNPYTCLFYGLSYIKILMNTVEGVVKNANRIEIARHNLQTMIFWGKGEKNSVEKRLGVKLKTKKIKIFSDENQLKKILTIIGYNGGTSVPVPVFRDFMNYLKRSLSNRKNTRMRSHLLAEGLSSSFFINSFESFLKRNYPSKSKSRREQVANYLSKVNKDIDHLNKNIQSRYPSFFPKDICPK